jgi:pseudouridine synthase
MSTQSNQPERINKALARLGYGSRRAIDTLIAQQRISVNGRPATLGLRITASDTIAIDGKPITQTKPRSVIIAFNKPAGVTTTKSDPFAKLTVMQFLPADLQHVFPVGRLDKDSRGLLLLTTNGDLALELQHPRYTHEKEYKVWMTSPKRMTADSFKRDLTTLATKIVSTKHQTMPIRVEEQSLDAAKQKGYARVVLTEGKKRQIRELFKQLGYHVVDLQRIRMGKLTLGTLKEGQYREVAMTEL